MVSHNSAMIENLCNRAVYLSQGHVVGDGKPSVVLAHYRRESAFEK